jgi:maltoporin
MAKKCEVRKKNGERYGADENRTKLQHNSRESAKPSDKATVSAAELAAENAVRKVLFGNSDQVGAQYQGQIPSVPIYDQLQEAETKIAGLQQQQGAFEFHGYLRSGYGLNSEGGQQVAFQAPGTEAKYRLFPIARPSRQMFRSAWA